MHLDHVSRGLTIDSDVYILIIKRIDYGSRCTGLILEPTGKARGQYRKTGVYWGTGAYRSYEGDDDEGRDMDFSKVDCEENLVKSDSVDHFAEVLIENGVKRYFVDLV